MEFEWDEKKNQSNINKHAIDFVDAARVIERGNILVQPSSYGGEKRFIAIGRYNERYMTVVYTMRGHVYRIISARVARRKERLSYDKEEKRRKNS